MRYIRLYTITSFFLMTLSAAIETWIATISGDHSLLLASYDLITFIAPASMNELERFSQGYFPFIWKIIFFTILQLPLWSFFAFLSAGFLYALLLDPPDLDPESVNVQELDIWTTSPPQEDGINEEDVSLDGIEGAVSNKHDNPVEPEIWCPTLTPEDAASSPNVNNIEPEIWCPTLTPEDAASSPNVNKIEQDIWQPILTPEDTSLNPTDNNIEPEIWHPSLTPNDENFDKKDNRLTGKNHLQCLKRFFYDNIDKYK